MHILHLSDLQATTEDQDLHTVWDAVASALGKRRFDVIIVSGDLTKRTRHAEPPEMQFAVAVLFKQFYPPERQAKYDELKTFAARTLLRQLSLPERERIIFVPGSHDVDWRSPKRASLDTLWRKNGEDHAARVKDVQHFLDEFYDGALTGQNKPFSLLEPCGYGDWSAHVFPANGVAFYGFSSCHCNGEHRRGSRISPDAVNAARIHAEKHAKQLLRIAVWHHGFSGEPGRPDHLTLRDIEVVRSGGFEIGFHGHSHNADFVAADLLNDRFVLVSTGSLGAKKTEREETSGNHFSIVELYPTRLSIEVWEKDDQQSYRPNDRRYRKIGLRGRTPQAKERASWSERNSRTMIVTPSGIAETHVTLERVRATGPITIAVIEPPPVNWRIHAATDGFGDVDHQERKLHDRRCKVTLSTGPAAGTDGLREYARLNWSYTASNYIVVNQAELALLDRPQPWYPQVKQYALAEEWPAAEGWAACSHQLRFDCDELVLRLRFVPELSGVTQPAVAIEDARPLVERFQDHGASERPWERVEAEEKRCVLKKEEHEATLTVLAPVVGCRYSIAYLPRDRGKPHGDQARILAEHLLSRCRKEQTEGDLPLVADLVRAISDCPRPLFPPTSVPPSKDPQPSPRLLSAQGTWVGCIWDFTARRLFPAFGELSPESWATRFAAGAGVAGHSFRFCSFAAYHRTIENDKSVIYQDTPEPYDSHSPEYQWVCCFPIRLAPEGPAIGVVWFASAEKRPRNPIEIGLDSFVRQIVTPGPDNEAVRQRDELDSRINVAFWTVLADGGHFPEQDGYRRFARKVLDRLRPERDASPHPGGPGHLPSGPTPRAGALTGAQHAQLVETLMAAFPDVSSLRQMLRFQLDASLDAIAIGSDLKDIVFNVIKDAEAKGRTQDLVIAARKENPGNPLLRAFAQQVGLLL